jgi:hypothetical protein
MSYRISMAYQIWVEKVYMRIYVIGIFVDFGMGILSVTTPFS